MASTTSATTRPTSIGSVLASTSADDQWGSRARPRRPRRPSRALDRAAGRERRVPADAHQIGVGHHADDASSGLGDREVVDAVGEHRRAVPRRPSVSRSIVRTGNVAISSTGVEGSTRAATKRVRRSRSVTMPQPSGIGISRRRDALRRPCAPAASATDVVGSAVTGSRRTSEPTGSRRRSGARRPRTPSPRRSARRMLPDDERDARLRPEQWVGGLGGHQVAERVLLGADRQRGGLIGEQGELPEHLALDQQVESMPSSSSSTAPLRTT